MCVCACVRARTHTRTRARSHARAHARTRAHLVDGAPFPPPVVDRRDLAAVQPQPERARQRQPHRVRHLRQCASICDRSMRRRGRGCRCVIAGTRARDVEARWRYVCGLQNTGAAARASVALPSAATARASAGECNGSGLRADGCRVCSGPIGSIAATRQRTRCEKVGVQPRQRTTYASRAVAGG